MTDTATSAKVASPKTARILKDAPKPAVASPAKRTPIPEGEAAKREFTFPATGKVGAKFSFKLNDKATERYQVESTFDFTGCTQEEILELAASSVRITIQGKLRAMGESALDPNAMRVVDVKRDVVETQRSVVDDTVKAIRALMKATGMSSEKCVELINANKKS